MGVSPALTPAPAHPQGDLGGDAEPSDECCASGDRKAGPALPRREQAPRAGDCQVALRSAEAEFDGNHRGPPEPLRLLHPCFPLHHDMLNLR